MFWRFVVRMNPVPNDYDRNTSSTRDSTRTGQNDTARMCVCVCVFGRRAGRKRLPLRATSSRIARARVAYPSVYRPTGPETSERRENTIPLRRERLWKRADRVHFPPRVPSSRSARRTRDRVYRRTRRVSNRSIWTSRRDDKSFSSLQSGTEILTLNDDGETKSKLTIFWNLIYEVFVKSLVNVQTLTWEN